MLDGFSLANAGLYAPITATDILQRTEKTVRDMSNVGIKQADQSKESKAQDKDEKSNAEGRDNDDATSLELKIAEEEKNDGVRYIESKKYNIKFNLASSMVELIDFKNGKIVETISPNDLVNMVIKSKNPAGILVDRAV